MKEEPDYDPDDDGEPVEPAPHALEPSDMKPEVLDRVCALLEEQRLHQQALLQQKQEDYALETFSTEVMEVLLGATPLAVLPLLDTATAVMVWSVRDANGKTLLHHAVRVGCWQIVVRLLELNPHLADQLTNPNGRPSHWSALMVCVDTGKSSMTEDEFLYVLDTLLFHSSAATLQVRASNGSSALHMAASKGMFYTVKRILYALYNKAQCTPQAFALCTACVNQPNGRGAGCVPWLEVFAEHILVY